MTWIVAPACAGSKPARCSASGSSAPATILMSTIASSEEAIATASRTSPPNSSTRPKPAKTMIDAMHSAICTSLHR